MSEGIEKWSVQQIKSKLNEMNVRIPTDKMLRKENYLELLREAIQLHTTPPPTRQSARTTIKPSYSPEDHFFTPVRDLPHVPLQESQPAPVSQIPHRSIVQPIQHTDIFERMMKAKFSNREIQEIETKGNKVKIDDIFLQLVILVLSILGGALIAYLFFGMLSSPIFCDTNQTDMEGCIACSEHAICEKGQMKCEIPYIRQGNECVKDVQILKNAYNMLEHVEEFVKENARDAYLTSKSVYETNSKELLRYLKDRYSDLPNFDETFREMHDILKSDKSTVLKIEEKSEILYISAKEGFLNIFDYMRIFINENLITIIAVVLVISSAVFYVLKKKQDMFLKSRAREMYITIKEQLRANVNDSYEHGLSEDLIKTRMANMLGERASKIVWPYLEEFRASDTNVCKFETSLGGRPKVMWQWKENVKPNQGERMKIL